MLRRGTLDYAAFSLETYDGLELSDAYQVIQARTTTLFSIRWNTSRSPWDRVEVRRALTASIDRRALAEQVAHDGNLVAEGPVPPQHWLHDPLLVSPSFDPSVTPKREATRLRLLCRSDLRLDRDVCSSIVGDLRRGGVDAEVDAVDPETYDARVREGDFDGTLVRTSMRSPRIAGELSLFYQYGPASHVGLRDTELDRLLTELSESSAAEYPGLFHEVDKRIVELQGYTYLFYAPNVIVHHERVRGVTASGLSAVESWWIPETLQ